MPAEVPTTSTPSPQEATGALTDIRGQGFTHALAIHISSGLSGTLDTVRMAAAQVKGLKTVVLDSRSLSMGLGFIVEQAAHWIEEKVGFDNIVARAEDMVRQSKAYFVLRSLDYLRRGGRIGAVSATVAGVLDLKPIISIDEQGKYYGYRRVRGRKQSLRELLEIARAGVESGLGRVAVVHGDAEEEGRGLLEMVKRLAGVKQVVFGQIGPALVVHTGPGLVGVALTRA